MKEISEFLYYWQSLIGTFIGSGLAAYIAIRSIKKTHDNQVTLENEKIRHHQFQEEKIYCGYLYSVWSLMIGHQIFLEELQRELKAILSDVNIKGRIAYDRAFTKLPIDLLKECYVHIIAYEKFDTNVVDRITAYLSFMDSLTAALDFTPLKKLQDEIKNKIEYYDRVERYFNDLKGRIDLLLEISSKLQGETLKIITNSQTSIVFDKGAKEIKETLEKYEKPNS